MNYQKYLRYKFRIQKEIKMTELDDIKSVYFEQQGPQQRYW